MQDKVGNENSVRDTCLHTHNALADKITVTITEAAVETSTTSAVAAKLHSSSQPR